MESGDNDLILPPSLTTLDSGWTIINSKRSAKEPYTFTRVAAGLPVLAAAAVTADLSHTMAPIVFTLKTMEEEVATTRCLKTSLMLSYFLNVVWKDVAVQEL